MKSCENLICVALYLGFPFSRREFEALLVSDLENLHSRLDLMGYLRIF